MFDQETVDGILKAIGAGDAAIVYMGPGMTILFAWMGSYAITQLFKFPLAMLVKNEQLHEETTRYFSVIVAFLIAHYISNHLTNIEEVVIAALQPAVYAACIWFWKNVAPGLLKKLPFLGGVSGWQSRNQP